MQPEREEITSSDFRLFLQQELVRRCKKNSRYSLRTFARALKIDHSTVSQFLRGRRKLSQAIQMRMAVKLGLGPLEVAKFWPSMGTASAPRPDRDSQARDLTLDAFQVIADWYHYAIFELVTLKDFKPDAKWISRTLGISVHEVHAAIERLRRLELIVVDEKGNWRQGAPLITTTGNPFTAVAFRKLQVQVLEMAAEAIDQFPIEVRDQSSMTMAMNRKRIPEAKERIRNFRRQLCDFLQQDQDRDCVYQLGMSFYPLTHSINGKEKEDEK